MLNLYELDKKIRGTMNDIRRLRDEFERRKGFWPTTSVINQPGRTIFDGECVITRSMQIVGRLTIQGDGEIIIIG